MKIPLQPFPILEYPFETKRYDTEHKILMGEFDVS